MIRVLIVDDQRLLREGLEVMLMNAEDIEVAGEARDGLEAVEAAVRCNPDVILMDIAMPKLNGLRATERLAAMGHPARILIASRVDDTAIIRAAQRTGASGYFVKGGSRAELIRGIRTVYEGGTYYSPAATWLMDNDK